MAHGQSALPRFGHFLLQSGAAKAAPKYFEVPCCPFWNLMEFERRLPNHHCSNSCACSASRTSVSPPKAVGGRQLQFCFYAMATAAAFLSLLQRTSKSYWCLLTPIKLPPLRICQECVWRWQVSLRQLVTWTSPPDLVRQEYTGNGWVHANSGFFCA